MKTEKLAKNLVFQACLAAKQGCFLGEQAYETYRGFQCGSLSRLFLSRLGSLSRREGKVVSTTLALPAGWRQQSDISRRVGTWPLRAMAIGGMTLEDLPAAARIPRNLDVKKIALLVKGVGNFGKHAAAKIAGFQKDSVIVAIDGNETRRTEGELLGWLRERHRAGEKAKVIVLRGTAPVELSLPMQ